MWPVRKTWRWRSESAAGTSASVFGAELEDFLLSQEVQAYVPAAQFWHEAAAVALDLNWPAPHFRQLPLLAPPHAEWYSPAGHV